MTPRQEVAGDHAIEIDALRVVRGGATVLDGVSLSVSAGKVTGLLGPSGSGKSTLLRSIVGTQRIAGGSVTVFDQPAGSSSLRRRVGYLTQAPSVYGDLTVRENLRYFARLVGASSSRVDEAIEAVALAQFTDRIVGRLSGGQRARVSLAAVLIGEPDLLVLDEPTVGLDPLLRRELWSLFHRLAAAGATLIVSSHVMDEADRCDELLLLREGKLVASGAPDELRRRTGKTRLEDVFLQVIEGRR
jgi:ABC-2 type transport system ATP-binding protein